MPHLTKDFLLKQQDDLEKQHVNALANANAVGGALQLLKILLAEWEAPEVPTAPTAPTAPDVIEP